MRAWKLVLYSRVLAPSPLSCIRFFTRSRGCTKTVAPILGEDRSGVKVQMSHGVTKGKACNATKYSEGW